MARDLKNDVRRRSETKETKALSRADPGAPEGAIPDDSGAEKRCGVNIREVLWDRVDKMVAGDDKFGKTPVDIISGEPGIRTEILLSSDAVFT